MTPKEALEYLIRSLQNKATCGRLSPNEREAVRILRLYFKEEENLQNIEKN